MVGSGGTSLISITRASIVSGTMTVARGRDFRRSAVIQMIQQIHNNNKKGKNEQMAIVNVSDDLDVLVTFMSLSLI